MNIKAIIYIVFLISTTRQNDDEATFDLGSILKSLNFNSNPMDLLDKLEGFATSPIGLFHKFNEMSNIGNPLDLLIGQDKDIFNSPVGMIIIIIIIIVILWPKRVY